jgi:hypothetical protein
MSDNDALAYVSGSHGTLIVDSETGAVLDYNPEYVEGFEGYGNIKRIDIEEWRKAYPGEPFLDCDILDVGYWTADDVYVPPESEWRAEFQAQR